ncbi:hypothetical protein [uncultured Cytophaga sp.]|uniref:hypothetical protein n=1 Tax=uncultured Cytophaga sp. TaxID=160238 RepID=UPI002626AB36|nr:hypothetical protein [uncultured Cytophaga sp.]
MFAIFIIGITNNSLAQSTPSNNEIEEDEIETMIIERDFSSLTTLNITAGKTYVFIVDIENQYSMLDGSKTNNQEKEEKELINNFGNDAFEIQFITSNTDIYFANNQKINFRADGELNQSFAYWSGKMEDNVIVKQGTHQSTEFVAEQMGVKKESSYVINTRRWKSEVALLQNKNNVTEKSKIVMNAFLSTISNTSFDNNIEKYANLFDPKNVKLKNIETYFDKNGSKVFIKKVSLNEKGQPILLKIYSRDGDESSSIQFIYENGMLTKSIDEEGEIILFTYDNEKMIQVESNRNENETTVFTLVDNMLLQKHYILKSEAYNNWCFEDKYENNCKITFSNNFVSDKECFSQIDKFPFIYKYTSFQDGEILQFEKSKIEKKDDKTFEMYFSKSESEGQIDDYQLWGTFKLNEKGLVNAISIINNNETFEIKIGYTYYP